MVWVGGFFQQLLMTNWPSHEDLADFFLPPPPPYFPELFYLKPLVDFFKCISQIFYHKIFEDFAYVIVLSFRINSNRKELPSSSISHLKFLLLIKLYILVTLPSRWVTQPRHKFGLHIYSQKQVTSKFIITFKLQVWVGGFLQQLLMTNWPSHEDLADFFRGAPPPPREARKRL